MLITGQEAFAEFNTHLLEDEKPSEYFKGLMKTSEIFKTYPFDMLGKLSLTEQNRQHHPEGSVWNHVMMVVDNAAARKQESKEPRALMWAALLHDIGKPPTTQVRRGKITSYDHDKVGAKMAGEFLSAFTQERDFIDKVVHLVRWHMQVLFVVKDMPFADITHMLDEVPLDEISLLCLCDRLGRGEMSQAKEEAEQEAVALFRKKCLRAKAD